MTTLSKHIIKLQFHLKGGTKRRSGASGWNTAAFVVQVCRGDPHIHATNRPLTYGHLPASATLRWRATYSKQVIVSLNSSVCVGGGSRRCNNAAWWAVSVFYANPQRPTYNCERVNNLPFLPFSCSHEAAADGCRSNRNSYPALTCRPWNHCHPTVDLSERQTTRSYNIARDRFAFYPLDGWQFVRGRRSSAPSRSAAVFWRRRLIG